MFRGVFALLGRSLRIDARGWSSHLTRLGLMGAIYSSLWFALLTEDMFGAPGLRFFYGMAYLEMAFMTLLGIGFFSTAITEEKEEDTLGLMLMAGISPLGILTGKIGGRMWQAVLLQAVQYPFLLLAATMGGITVAQIWAATVALAGYTIFLAGFGLFCSTIADRSRSASGFMIAGLVCYFVLPGLGKWLTELHAGWSSTDDPDWNISPTWWALLERIGDLCIYLQMGEILETGFAESPWSLQFVSNTMAGCVFAGLSWLLFGLVTRSPSTEASSRGLVSRRRAFFRFAAERPRFNPFVWKDFHFVSGGIPMTLIRVTYYSLIATVVLVAQYLKDYSTEDSWVEPSLLLMSFSVAVDGGIVLARSVHDEIRNQTLSTLLMLPRSLNAIMYSKFAGALLGWIPGPIIELVFAMLTSEGRSDLASLASNHDGGYLLVLLFALIPHFAAVSATYLRWGAVPMAIGLTIGIYFAIIGAVILFGRGDPGEIFFAVLTIVATCICIGCHIGTLLRIQTLGAK